MYTHDEVFVKKLFGAAAVAAPILDTRVSEAAEPSERISSSMKPSSIEIPAGHPVAAYLAYRGVFFACEAAGDGCRLVVHVGDHAVRLMALLLNYVAEHNDRAAARCDEVVAMLAALAFGEDARCARPALTP